MVRPQKFKIMDLLGGYGSSDSEDEPDVSTKPCDSTAKSSASGSKAPLGGSNGNDSLGGARQGGGGGGGGSQESNTLGNKTNGGNDNGESDSKGEESRGKRTKRILSIVNVLPPHVFEALTRGADPDSDDEGQEGGTSRAAKRSKGESLKSRKTLAGLLDKLKAAPSSQSKKGSKLAPRQVFTKGPKEQREQSKQQGGQQQKQQDWHQPANNTAGGVDVSQLLTKTTTTRRIKKGSAAPVIDIHADGGRPQPQPQPQPRPRVEQQSSRKDEDQGASSDSEDEKSGVSSLIKDIRSDMANSMKRAPGGGGGDYPLPGPVAPPPQPYQEEGANSFNGNGGGQGQPMYYPEPSSGGAYPSAESAPSLDQGDGVAPSANKRRRRARDLEKELLSGNTSNVEASSAHSLSMSDPTWSSSSYAMNPSHAAPSAASGSSNTARRKNHISHLVANANRLEEAAAWRSESGGKTKRETNAKYGW